MLLPSRTAALISAVLLVTAAAVAAADISQIHGPGYEYDRAATPTTLAAATQFYVSTSGDDSWDGSTPAHAAGTAHGPFATPGRAAAAVAALPHPRSTDVTVNLAAGTYELGSTLPLVGSSAATVTWTGPATGPKAVLSGGTAITGWKLVNASTSLWSAPVPASITVPFTSLAAGTTWVHRARTPNIDAADPYFVWAKPICSTFRSSPTCAQRARLGFVAQTADVHGALGHFADPTNVQFIVYHGWTASRHWLSGVNSTSCAVNFANPSDRPIGYWPNHDSEGGGRYYFEGPPEALDSPGEWALDWPNKRVLYMARAGDAPETMGFVAPRLTVLASANATAGLQVRDLTFAHAKFDCSRTTQCDGQSTAWQTTAAVDIVNSSRVQVTGVEVAAVGQYAVWVRGAQSTGVTVTSCSIHDLGSGGIRIGENAAKAGPSNVNATDNVITRGGFAFASGTPVLVQKASRVLVSHNEASYHAYAGISVGWSWNYADPSFTSDIEVSYNHVHHLGADTYRQLGDAMAAVYTLGVQHGSHVHHNLLHDVYAWYTGGYCLSQDQGSSFITFDNNVCARTTGASQTQHYGIGNAYTNNVFASAFTESWTTKNSAGVRAPTPTNQPNSFLFERNIVVSTNASGCLFLGNYENSNATPNVHNGTFSSNLWWSTQRGDALANASVWGGDSLTGALGGRLTWDQWRRGCGTSTSSSPARCSGPRQDAGSVIADPRFADLASLNFTLPPDSPAFAVGFTPIDLSGVGPRRATVPDTVSP